MFFHSRRDQEELIMSGHLSKNSLSLAATTLQALSKILLVESSLNAESIQTAITK